MKKHYPLQLITKLFISLLLLGLFIFGLKYSKELKGSEVQKILFDKLSQEKKFSASELFPQAKLICILPYYKKNAYESHYLTIEQKKLISTKIGNNISDSYWWLILIDESTELQAFKIYGLAVPNFKSTKCYPQSSAVISFAEKDILTFFNFYEEK